MELNARPAHLEPRVEELQRHKNANAQREIAGLAAKYGPTQTQLPLDPCAPSYPHAPLRHAPMRAQRRSRAKWRAVRRQDNAKTRPYVERRVGG